MISIRLSTGGEIDALLPAGDHGAVAAGELGQLGLGEAGPQPRLPDQFAAAHIGQSLATLTHASVLSV